MRWIGLLAALGLSAPALAEVPIEIAATGHATVPVKGTFGSAQFVFDTGAEGSAVYANFANSAGLAIAGTETLQGQTGTKEVPTVRLTHITLDGVRRESLSAVKLEPRADGVPLAGIIGLDLFGDRTVDFDLPNKRVALLASGARADSLTSRPIAASTTAGNLLTVPVSIGSVIAIAVIDTGARKTRINWALGRLLGLDPASLAKGDTIQGATNKAIETAVTRVLDVHLGSRRLTDAPVLVADLPVFEAFGVADRPAIILGLDWLEKTRMVIDFPARLVWFEADAPGVIQAPAAGCADGWAVALDLEGFAHNGAGHIFPEARLAAFRGQIETAVRGAVNLACSKGVLDPARAKTVKGLTVQSASGAADPTFFGDGDASAVSLQWTFAENDLTIPSEMELREGLVCWTDPESDLCAEREP